MESDNFRIAFSGTKTPSQRCLSIDVSVTGHTVLHNISNTAVVLWAAVLMTFIERAEPVYFPVLFGGTHPGFVEVGTSSTSLLPAYFSLSKLGYRSGSPKI
jgi:hypothetical protein